MLKIIFYNFFLIIVMVVCCASFLYKYLITEKTEGAIRQLASIKENPYYNNITRKIGSLPKNNVPTHYLKVKPDQEKIKIGFFGDSHTMGSEVNPGHDFPSVLQNILGSKYQVINFGQAGYNSNQIFLMAKYFSKKFDLDLMVIGPRGFYTERTTTFNNYWNQGTIPYSRFTLERGELKELSIPGNTVEEKIFNYYGLIPSWTVIRYDHVAPSVLRLYDLLFEKEILNPFFQKTRDLKVRSIQIAQLEDLSKFFKKPIIHYTDYLPDCDIFKKVKANNYSLHCVKRFINEFPFQAKISHPSSFGHYRHAKNIESILFKHKHSNNHYRFVDDKKQYRDANFFELTGEPINFDNLGVLLEGTKVARLGKSWGYKDTSGRLKIYDHEDKNFNHEKYFLLGFYLDGATKASSLFIKVQATKSVKNLLDGLRFKQIKGISNILFLKVPGQFIHHPVNKIFSSQKWMASFPLLSFFTESQDKNYFTYKPKYPSYKMIVDKQISASIFFNDMTKKKIKTVITEIR